jgi:hypothetical protein
MAFVPSSLVALAVVFPPSWKAFPESAEDHASKELIIAARAAEAPTLAGTVDSFNFQYVAPTELNC